MELIFPLKIRTYSQENLTKKFISELNMVDPINEPLGKRFKISKSPCSKRNSDCIEEDNMRLNCNNLDHVHDESLISTNKSFKIKFLKKLNDVGKSDSVQPPFLRGSSEDISCCNNFLFPRNIEENVDRPIIPNTGILNINENLQGINDKEEYTIEFSKHPLTTKRYSENLETSFNDENGPKPAVSSGLLNQKEDNILKQNSSQSDFKNIICSTGINKPDLNNFSVRELYLIQNQTYTNISESSNNNLIQEKFSCLDWYSQQSNYDLSYGYLKKTITENYNDEDASPFCETQLDKEAIDNTIQISRNKDDLCKWLQETKFETGFIDTHCHIDFLFKKLKFKNSFRDYMKICEINDPFPKSFEGCIAVFCDPITFQKIDWWEDILNTNDNIWGAFGCHPHFADNFGPNEEVFLRYALTKEKVKAIGEIGLDFSGRNENSKELQEKVFRNQLSIAKDLEKPLVIHSRDAYPLCLTILKEVLPIDFIIHRHCFTGDLEEASEWLEQFPNCYLGLTNLITQDSQRASKLRDVVKKIPLNRLLLETDSPYFKPPYLLSIGLNSHPGMAIHVANALATIKDISIEKVLLQTRENTRAVYSI